ncbi:metallophosphoesterase [Micromonospora sp. NPDC092111]|uniref:metallophosphoesterase family protein n=1 Tax=Micromonospora sp. NPDC092111 TaxID=3364289 RepID=UPI0037F86620
MRITGPDVKAVTEVAYQQARSGGGTETVRLPVGRLGVAAVPDGCDAVVVTGDLQGVAPSPWGGAPVLLGVALADYLHVWADQGLLPPPQRVVVVLAGDLYSSPRADRRGASGEVDDVWLAFAAAGCPSVLGVAGNHDVVSADDLRDLGPAATLLDGTWVDHGGVRFAGVSGIVGDPHRPGRRSEGRQLASIDAVLADRPDVLVLHEGPAGDGIGQAGNRAVGARLRAHAPALTVCGHVHWDEPLARLGDGHILNVDGRVVLLTPAP